MKVNTAVMAITGRHMGSMTRHQTPRWAQPSSRAASTSASGTWAMNWRNMKMKNAFPKNAGTTRGRIVSTQPSSRKTRNMGIIVTWGGSIIVPSITANSSPRPRKRTRARA